MLDLQQQLVQDLKAIGLADGQADWVKFLQAKVEYVLTNVLKGRKP